MTALEAAVKHWGEVQRFDPPEPLSASEGAHARALLGTIPVHRALPDEIVQQAA